MQLITELNDNPKQNLRFIVDTGEEFTISFVYRENAQLWFYDLQYQDFILNGMGLVVSPNILRQWKNIIPFGISVISNDINDPFFLDDFKSGRVQLIVLNKNDVETVENLSYGL